MTTFQPSTPRTAFGVLSCALTVATFSLLIAGPAALVAPCDSAVVALAAPAEIRVLPPVTIVGIAAPAPVALNDEVRVMPPVTIVGERQSNLQLAHARVARFLRSLNS
jgi:hypothetical protein